MVPFLLLLLLHTLKFDGMVGPDVPQDAPTVDVTFVQPDDTLKQVKARIGETLLQTAHRNEIDLEGACEGVCACSTCHLIFPMDIYDTLPEPSEDEEDMFGHGVWSYRNKSIGLSSDRDGRI